MSLADSLKEAVANEIRPHVCSVVKAKAKMSKDDIATLEAALYNRDIKATVLGRVLQKEGIDISSGTITRHRNGWCKSC